MKTFQIVKPLYKKINLQNLDNTQLKLDGFFINKTILLKKGSIIVLTPTHLLVKKNFLRSFFHLLLKTIDGISYGFENRLYLKGKGLRFQLKTINKVRYLYLKLGYSHKILFLLPSNMWLKLKERRRQLILYGFDYVQLRSLIFKIKNYYRLSLYKIRGFIEPLEIHKVKKGNLN